MNLHHLGQLFQRNENVSRWAAAVSVLVGLSACQRAPVRDAPSAAASTERTTASAPARGLPCWETAQTQAELNSCASAEAKQAETEMNDTLAVLLKAHAANADAVQKLNAAQSAWLAYRDAALAARFPSAQPATDYGSSFPTCFGLEQARLFRNRARALRELTADDAHDSCSPQDGG